VSGATADQWKISYNSVMEINDLIKNRIVNSNALNINNYFDIEGFLNSFAVNIVSEYNKIRKDYADISGKYSDLITKYNEHLKDTEAFYSNLPDYIKQMIKEHQGNSATLINKRHISPSLKVKILKRDNYTCVWCGISREDGARLHIDHIIPVNSEKGKAMSAEELNAPDNLRTLCNDCNIGKSNKLDEQLNI